MHIPGMHMDESILIYLSITRLFISCSSPSFRLSDAIFNMLSFILSGLTGSSLCIIYELINDPRRKKIKRQFMLGTKWTEGGKRTRAPQAPPPDPSPPTSSSVMSVKAKLDWSLSVSGQLHGSLVITKLKSQIRGVPVFFLTSFHRLALTSADSPPPQTLILILWSGSVSKVLQTSNLFIVSLLKPAGFHSCVLTHLHTSLPVWNDSEGRMCS